MTLTREQITEHLGYWADIASGLLVSSHTPAFAKEMASIHYLALSALDMQPKPIAEAPKDGSWILGMTRDYGDVRPVQWVKRKQAWCDCPDGDRFDSWQPTYFTALPKVPS